MLSQNQQKFYYSACGKIYQHIRHQKNTLNLENKLKVHDCSKIVIMNLFAMTVVDEWLDFNSCTLAEETQKEFYKLLAEEIIEISYDNSNMARQSQRDGGD